MTKKISILVILLVSLSLAQKTSSLFFSADDIYKTAKALTGDSTSWPILVSLATRNVEQNGFTLTQHSLEQIKVFSKAHAAMKAAKAYFAHLLKAGARVFAAEALNNAVTLSTTYDLAVRDGNISQAILLSEQYVSATDKIAKEIAEKRTEEVDAMIAQRHGDVTKRRGLLGQWINAVQGDVLKQSDGVKTGDASFAQLAFTDGCEVMIDPNSTVLIRQSNMDKLDLSIRRDIALVRGGLLTTLTASAKERNRLRLTAGTSQAEVKSGKFWASAAEERRVTLSNYDGTMKVAAHQSEVRLAANEGTVVEQGKPPMKPVPLLSPPQLRWSSIDSTIYGSELQLVWTPIRDAAHYKIELSPTKEFNTAIKTFSTKTAALKLTNIQLGVLFVRLYAVDKLGLRGIESPVYKIVRVEDTVPPPLYVYGWETDRKYTILTSVTVSGTTEPDAQLTVDGTKHPVNSKGEFSFKIPVGKTEQRIKLQTVDRSGNVRERTLSVVPMDSNKVTHIEWNCQSDGVTLFPTTNEISGRGVSYPGVKITATLGEQTTSVQTDSQGNWAISVRKISGGTLTLIFESLSDNTIIAKRTLQVQE
ncbi:MAG: FecR domain-containing protein [Bacteroidota bacterium]